MGGPATLNPPTSSSTSSKSGGASLKKQWDLKEPQLGEVGGSEQAKKFAESFKATMQPVNTCLQYTKSYAIKEKHDAMVAKRDYQYTNFQSVQGQIDPNDESKAKGPIEQYLNQTRALAGEANTLKQQTEASVKAWQAKEASYDKQDQQIGELETWGDPLAPELRNLATAILTATNEHKYDEAVKMVDQLQTNLKPPYDEYQKQLAAKKTYDTKWEGIKSPVETALAEEAAVDKLKEPQQKLKDKKGEMEGAAAKKDYVTANKHLDDLPPLREAFDKANKEHKAAKAYYEANWATLKPRLEQALGGEPASQEIKAAQSEISNERLAMENAAEHKDYVSAKGRLEKLPAALDKLKQMLRTLYEKTWAELKKQLPTSSQKGSPKEAELRKQLLELSTKVESAAASGDYVAALKQIEDVKPKLKELTAEHEAYEKRKKEFENRLNAMKPAVDTAVGTSTDVKELKATQDAVKAKKTEAEKAATAGDYEAGLTRLDELDAALKAHQDELRKSPQECNWVRDTAGMLQGLIQIKYLDACNKINNAAQAYDNALNKHTGTLKSLSAKKQLAADILSGIFFAGLGGAVGGAVGQVVKNNIAKEFEKLASSGAIIDASKDVFKFTTKSLEKFGGKPGGDPTAGLPGVGKSGTELARSVGSAVNAQGKKLYEEVVKLYQLVRGNPQCKDGTVRIEGDPVQAVQSDPFLKVLGTIVDADEKVFGNLLWGKWIEQHAYDVGTICKNDNCRFTVDSNVDGFFGWWADMRKNIVAQTGQDFGLQARLDAARAEVQKKADELNQIGR